MSTGRLRVAADQQQRPEMTGVAASYLHRYGYMKSKVDSKHGSLVDLEKAVRQFQAFAGLEESGQLDSQTIQLMEAPRCGVKDIVEEDSDLPRIKVRTKRYALQGSRWRVKDLTYKIAKYPETTEKLSRRDVDVTMRKAFDVWSKVTNLRFEEKTSGKAHIEIRFEKRAHGDDDPFDGEGGTLAHAFFPVFGGDAHFDEEEHWTVDTPRGTSLLMTAAHELGHSLGLSHSSDRTALMAPFYRGYEKDISLAQDDIEGIEALYGERTVDNDIGSNRNNNILPSITTSTTTTPAPINNRELCNGVKLDTIVTLENDTTYAFVGNKYWKLTETSVAPGYPRSISADWDGLPGNLDASFTWSNGRTYFFKGSEYWRFTNGRLDSGYPKLMSQGFSGVPTNVDAAIVWPKNNKIYFFKGSSYWRFDPDASPPVDDSYPRPISNWDGIPNGVEAALQYSNGKTYFFKSGQYYRFDDESFKLAEANPPFPRDTGFWWFGCKNSPLRNR